MTSILRIVFIGVSALMILAGGWSYAQSDLSVTDPAATPSGTRAALARALAQQRDAERRSEALEARAASASLAVEKTANSTAALAARIQQSEAGIAAAEARLVLIDRQRARLDRRLAARREPLIRLTGALQTMARRPLILSALRPGSLRETVYLRAMLESTVPQVRDRTSALRGEIARGVALEKEAGQALSALRRNESDLRARRTRLATLETRQRLASRQASSDAAREGERALALAEEARDLDAFIGELDAAGGLRKELAALPGPVLRPGSPGSDRPGNSGTIARRVSPSRPASVRFQLPVGGRTLAGFGTTGDTGIRNDGVTLAPRPGAQVVAPARGRVAFAGPYRGYGRIVIIEHARGWTSLVTGLARTDVEVGQELVTGSPLGIAAVASPRVTLELRRDGTPVNPLQYLR